MVRDSNDQPCANTRFGCWVCTVVRRDKSVENMLRAGYEKLTPYHEFRQWIAEIRNDPRLRCRLRRNGQKAPGPFKLKTRQMILAKVRDLEKKIGKSLISK